MTLNMRLKEISFQLQNCSKIRRITGRLFLKVLRSNEFLYDLCDWKIGDFSAVANRLLNVCS